MIYQWFANHDLDLLKKALHSKMCGQDTVDTIMVVGGPVPVQRHDSTEHRSFVSDQNSWLVIKKIVFLPPPPTYRGKLLITIINRVINIAKTKFNHSTKISSRD